MGLVVRGEKGWSSIKAANKREIDIPETTLLSLLFYRGRVFNSRRENFINNYQYSGRRQFNGLDKKVRESLQNYKNLKLNYDNLLYEYAKSIVGDNYEDIKEWINESQKSHEINLFK